MRAARSTVAIVSLDGGPKVQPRPGPFERVFMLSIGEEVADPVSARMKAAELARREQADWMIALTRDEDVAMDALELAAPALSLYDAIFGSSHVRGSGEAVARLSRLAFDERERLPHALLHWWMPDAHLVRTDVAAQVLARTSGHDANWKLDYLFDLWSAARCLKSAQPHQRAPSGARR